MNNKRAIKRGEEGESIVSSIIEKDASFHRLINNLILLGDNHVSHQIDHILIRENGIFVIETKNYYGEIKGQEDDSYWTRSYFVKGKRRNVLFHNPLKQNQSHIRAVKKVLGRNYPIYTFVVFIQNNADGLDLFNVCNSNTLLARINLITCDKSLSKEEIEQIYNHLLDNEAYLSVDDHLNKIKEVEVSRKDNQKKMRFAIEKRICPDCGKNLLIKGSSLVCPGCGYSISFK